MATHDYIISNASGAAVRADLNNALAAIVSNNSSATEPATTYAYQWWADTTAGELKLRNSTNDGWNVISDLDGGTFMEDGTAALPGLPFASDLNTGLFRPAADQLGISTGGVERVEFGTTEVVFNDGGADVDFRVEGNTEPNLLRVDAGNDRVGIGTSSPDGKLHSVGGTANGLNVAGIFTGGTAGGAGSGDTDEVQLRLSTNNSNADIRGAWISALNTTGVSQGHDILFYTNPASSTPVERVRISTDGNVGIGADNPEAKLDITSGLGSTDQALLVSDTDPIPVNTDFTAQISTYGQNSSGLTGSKGGLYVQAGFNRNIDIARFSSIGSSFVDVPRMVIKDSGNVGISTTSPAVKLDVNGEIRASTGILFGTDTAADNTLDDYEEGTWTPVLTGNTTTGSYNYVTQEGTYTKVGNLVTVIGNLDDITQSSAGSGAIKITGLPFTNGSIQALGAVRFNAVAIPNTRVGVASKIDASGTDVAIVSVRDDSSSPSIPVTDINFGNAGIQFTITYRVA